MASGARLRLVRELGPQHLAVLLRLRPPPTVHARRGRRGGGRDLRAWAAVGEQLRALGFREDQRDRSADG